MTSREASMLPDRRRRTFRSALPLVGIVLAAVVPYLGILHAPFVFDDIKLVQENVHLDLGWDRVGEIAETFNIFSQRWADEELRPNYRPLRFLSYFLDFKLTRLFFGSFAREDVPPFFFHLSNVIIHALNSLLVYVLARRLAALLSPVSEVGALALFSGLLFALHPLQTEAVTYVSGRRDVLSTFFFLAAVALYSAPHLRARVSLRSAVALPFLLVGGLLTKEMVATLPAVLVLVDLVRRSRWSLGRVLLHASLFALVAAHIGITLSRAQVVALAPAGVTAGSVVFTACGFVTRYLGLLVFPWSQSVDYSFDAIPESVGLFDSPTTFVAVIGVGLLLGVATLALGRAWVSGAAQEAPAQTRFGAWTALGIFWFLGTLVPVLQIVPIPERFAERFAYLPGVGIILLAALLLARLRARERLVGSVVAGVLCGAFLLATIVRNDAWKTPLRLWTAAVEAQPRCARAHLGRANWLKVAGRPREASDEYTLALEIFSEQPELPLHQGYILQALTFRGEVFGTLAQDEPEIAGKAIDDYRRLLGMRDTDGTPIAGSPRHTMIHFNLAGVLLLAGETAESEGEYRRVLEIGEPQPLVAASHYYLGKIELALGDVGSALDSLRAALEKTPLDDPAFVAITVELAELLISQSEYDEAWEILERGIGRVRGRQQLHLLMRQAKILDRRGKTDETVELLEAILHRDSTYFAATLTLADLKAARNEFEDAGRLYAEVLRRDPSNAQARQGLQAVAIRRSAQASEDDPKAQAKAEMDALLSKGSEQVAAGEFIAAVKVYERLLDLAHGEEAREVEFAACRELARLVEQLGRHRLSEEYLLRALDLKRDDAEVLRRLGDLRLQHLEEPEKARVDYERYLDLVSADAIPEPYVLFNLALLLKDDAPGRALVYAQRAEKAEFDDIRLDRVLGELHAAVGEWEKALDAFNRYLDRLPADQETERKSARDFVREIVLPRLLEEG